MTAVRTKTRAEHMAHATAADAAANKWAAVAAQHEAAARNAPWSKSVMTAMEARDNEARCRDSAKWSREMACDVR